MLAGAAGGFLKEHAGIKDVIKGGAQGFAAGSAGKGVRNIGQGLLNRVGSQGASNAAASTGGMGGGAGGSSAPSSLLSPAQIRAGGTIAESANLPAAGGEFISAGAGAPTSVLGQGTMIGGKVAEAPGVLGRAANVARDVGSFAKNNSTAVGMGLQGIGNLASAGSENRLNDAQADALEQRTNETAYDFEQRKRREEALKGLWSPLGSAIGSSYAGIAANPYAPQAGA